MIETVFAQLRFAVSLIRGSRIPPHSLDQLIAALQDTRREFGEVNPQGETLVAEPTLDEEMRQQVQSRRFRAQAVRAARETSYYCHLFEHLHLDPARLRSEEITLLPLTLKKELRATPDAFVCRTARPFLQAMTTGTTGRSTCICFSEYELRIFSALTAISALFSHDIEAEDVVQISTSAHGTLGNVCLAGACASLGATVYLAGVVEPAHALTLLSEPRHLPGKKPRTSLLCTYPSYLGELIECGLRLGYRPTDFGLERISIGGEIVTEGLKTRTQQLFGPVQFLEGYGMTEIWPFGGRLCEEHHLHFEVSQGLLEVSHIETAAPAQPGEMGTIVATPFPPYRETTIVLRYNTEDVVQALFTPLTCRLRHLPATSKLFGKLNLSVQHEQGWTFPRQVAEALEAIEDVPLPARYGFQAVKGGVAVEVVTQTTTPHVRCKIGASLEEQGIPLRALHLVEERHCLQHPMPLRGDLREQMFDASTLHSPVMNGTDILAHHRTP